MIAPCIVREAASVASVDPAPCGRRHSCPGQINPGSVQGMPLRRASGSGMRIENAALDPLRRFRAPREPRWCEAAIPVADETPRRHRTASHSRSVPSGQAARGAIGRPAIRRRGKWFPAAPEKFRWRTSWHCWRDAPRQLPVYPLAGARRMNVLHSRPTRDGRCPPPGERIGCAAARGSCLRRAKNAAAAGPLIRRPVPRGLR